MLPESELMYKNSENPIGMINNIIDDVNALLIEMLYQDSSNYGKLVASVAASESLLRQLPDKFASPRYRERLDRACQDTYNIIVHVADINSNIVDGWSWINNKANPDNLVSQFIRNGL